MKYIFYILYFIIYITLPGCSTPSPLKSLCTMDFDDKMCWVSKEKKQGFSFVQMQQQQAMCQEPNSNTPCWMAVDTDDVQTVGKALNECKNPKPPQQ